MEFPHIAMVILLLKRKQTVIITPITNFKNQMQTKSNVSNFLVLMEKGSGLSPRLRQIPSWRILHCFSLQFNFCGFEHEPIRGAGLAGWPIHALSNSMLAWWPINWFLLVLIASNPFPLAKGSYIAKHTNYSKNMKFVIWIAWLSFSDIGQLLRTRLAAFFWVSLNS